MGTEMSCCKKCKDCKWWHPNEVENAVGFHLCTNSNLIEAKHIHSEYAAMNVGAFGGIYTGPDFGCVHWEPRD